MRLDAAATYFKEEGFKDDALIDGLRKTGEACYNIFAKWDPEGVAEHDAIAKAAQVDPADLYTITNYTDVRDAFMLAGNKPMQKAVPLLWCQQAVPKITGFWQDKPGT